jgi:hypothetical protein
MSLRRVLSIWAVISGLGCIIPSPIASSIWLSSSHADPIAILRNLASSFWDPLPAPSAMFELIDTTDDLI